MTQAPTRPSEAKPFQALKPQAGHVSKRPVLGLTTATLLVIANMVGTGVFTTSGLLLQRELSITVILIAWLVGGFLAISGALPYGELVGWFPQNGGEYRLLSRIFHPAIGFTAGTIAFIVGFSAPIAASALAFGHYMVALIPGTPPVLAAWALVVVLSLLHVWRVSMAAGALNTTTIGKGLLMVFFTGLALYQIPSLRTMPSALDGVAPGHPLPSFWNQIFSSDFASSLLVVSFSYSGWNAAAYVAGELKDPRRTLPIALIIGICTVTVLYVALNYVFVVSGPREKLAGVVEIGHVASYNLFGERMGSFLSGIIALGLVSTVGAMIMTGPRVYEAMGEDFPAVRFLAVRMRDGGPALAIAFQAAVSLILIVTSGFEKLLSYVGFMLSLISALTVYGLFIVRKTHPVPPKGHWYRTWGYPFTPIIFIAVNIWSMGSAIVENPAILAAGVGTVALCLVLYALVKRRGYEGHVALSSDRQ